MKHILPLLIAGALSAQAITTQSNWQSDSDTGFSLTLAGVGVGLNWDQDFISPSGLWKLNIFIDAGYFPGNEGSRPHIEMNHAATATFLGLEDQPQFRSHGYNDVFSNVTGPIYENEFWIFDMASSTFNDWGPKGYGGAALPWIVSFPVLEDPSSWTWTMNVRAFGPTGLLPHGVPESGNTLAFLGIAIGGILFIWRKP